MNISGFPRLRSITLAPLSLVALFIIYNFAVFFFSNAFLPSVKAVVNSTGTFARDEIPTSGNAHIDRLILNAGEKYGVDPRLLHAVIWKESKYDTHARSYAGAQGLMQLMPATALYLNCRNINDPGQNIEAGTKYIRLLLEKFDGNVVMALAAYNAGEGSVDKYKGVPPFSETQNYVRIITSRYGKTFHPLFTPENARIEFGLAQEIAQLAPQK
jgi:soluble lytic murein transglycosylase-like protein